LAEDEFPLTETGELLTKILINYFALIEQITLNPAHVVPGIEASPGDAIQVIILLWLLLS
jgi:catalase